MAKYETMTIPELVEEPDTKNEWSDFEEMADPFDSKNGELVEKDEVKNIDQKAVRKILDYRRKLVMAFCHKKQKENAYTIEKLYNDNKKGVQTNVKIYSS